MVSLPPAMTEAHRAIYESAPYFVIMSSKIAIVPLPERGTSKRTSATSLGMPIYARGFASQPEIMLERPLALNISIHTNMDAM